MFSGLPLCLVALRWESALPDRHFICSSPENRRDLPQLCNIAVLDAFCRTSSTSSVHLLATMAQFARIILLPPEA